MAAPAAAPSAKEREYATLIPAAALRGLLGRGAEADAGPGAAAAGGRGGPTRGRDPCAADARPRGKRGRELHRRHAVSILEIYQAVRAECGNLVVGSEEQKFAYVLSPDAADVDLEQVAAAIESMERSGTVEIVRRPPARKR